MAVGCGRSAALIMSMQLHGHVAPSAALCQPGEREGEQGQRDQQGVQLSQPASSVCQAISAKQLWGEMRPWVLGGTGVPCKPWWWPGSCIPALLCPSKLPVLSYSPSQPHFHATANREHSQQCLHTSALCTQCTLHPSVPPSTSSPPAPLAARAGRKLGGCVGQPGSGCLWIHPERRAGREGRGSVLTPLLCTALPAPACVAGLCDRAPSLARAPSTGGVQDVQPPPQHQHHRALSDRLSFTRRKS